MLGTLYRGSPGTCSIHTGSEATGTCKAVGVHLSITFRQDRLLQDTAWGGWEESLCLPGTMSAPQVTRPVHEDGLDSEKLQQRTLPRAVPPQSLGLHPHTRACPPFGSLDTRQAPRGLREVSLAAGLSCAWGGVSALGPVCMHSAVGDTHCAQRGSFSAAGPQGAETTEDPAGGGGGVMLGKHFTSPG